MFNFLKKKKKSEDINLYAVATGEVIAIEQVNDPVFSQKMMGDGFAVLPTNGEVHSPVSGEILSIFPTKHALGIKMSNGLEVLLHMGIDTVELEGKPFELKVKEGDTVTGDTMIAVIDLEALEAAGKHKDLVVAITNTDEALKDVTLSKLGQVTAGDIIGEATAK